MLREQLVTQGATVGKYRIEARVAEGGMGVFWRALDTQLDRRVGLKTLHTEFVLEPKLRERFINEARALARLNHPNICVLYDFFEANQQLYIVMEYIVGETLADLVKKKRTLERDDIVPIFRQILLGLDYAHNHGVIHRDIKPSNIMITEQGMVKVMDFGIAKMVGSQLHLTHTGRRVGSVLFMSPEQIREGQVDHRSDLYAVGATLYQVCTGRVPFDATSEYDAMKMHLEQMPPRPKSVNPKVTDDLDYVIMRAMAKRPEDRFQSAMDMRRALSAADLKISGDRVTIPSGEKTRFDVDDPDGAARPKKRGPGRALLVSGIAAVALAAGGYASRTLWLPYLTTPVLIPAPSEVAATPPPHLAAAWTRDSLAQSLVPVDASLAGMAAVIGSSGEPDFGSLDATPTLPLASASVQEQKAATPTPPAKASDGAVVRADATPPRVKAQPKRIAEAPAKPVVLKQYAVSVVVKPAGTFQIDRMPWGQTGEKLDEGIHSFMAAGPGYPIVTTPFNLRGDTTIAVDLSAGVADLDEGDLRVFAKTESGAFPACRVRINGAEVGQLPGLRLRLKEGAYIMELVPPAGLKVDSLQFEGQTFAGASAQVRVKANESAFARGFLHEQR